jgi:hypothetical protein
MQQPIRPDTILPGESNRTGLPEDRAPLAAEPAWIIETHSLTKRFHHLAAVDGLVESSLAAFRQVR